MSNTSIAATQRVVARGAEMRSNSSAMSSREVLPAMPVPERGGLVPSWLTNTLRRIDELSQLREDWDSYGASALKVQAAEQLFYLLVRLNSYIQSQPSVSMTDDGGLLAEWVSSQSVLELTAYPAAPVSVCVYYHDQTTNREWELPLSQCDQIEKWLWKASSGV